MDPGSPSNPDAESAIAATTPQVEPGVVAAEGPGRRARGRSRGRWALRLPMGLALGGLVGLVVKELELPALVSYDGSREVLVVLISLLLAVLWALGLRRIVGTMAAGAAALWCLVAFTPLCPILAEGLVMSEILEDADAVFVSQAALPPGESGRVESWNRLVYGAELIARRKAPIMVTGPAVAGDPGGKVPSILGRYEMDEAQIITTAATGNTREEALELARLTRDKDWDLVIVVTSPIHSRRAAATMAQADVRVLLAPAPERRFDLADLSRARDRIGAFGGVIHERMGILVYGLRGWL